MEGQYYGFMESVRGSFMRILVCGGRDFDDPYLFAETLVEYDKPIIITGYDPEKEYPSGADKMAYIFAIMWHLECLTFPYHYHLGKAGGGSRNQQMIDEGKPDLCIAFPTPNSRGTWDMVSRCREHNIETIIIE
jgi:hypothetical protein